MLAEFVTLDKDGASASEIPKTVGGRGGNRCVRTHPRIGGRRRVVQLLVAAQHDAERPRHGQPDRSQPHLQRALLRPERRLEERGVGGHAGRLPPLRQVVRRQLLQRAPGLLLHVLVLREPRRQYALRLRVPGPVVAVRNRRLQFGAVVLAAAATAGLLTQLGLGGSDKVQIGNGSVSALTHASRPADSLPQSVLDYPFAERNFASPNGGGSRLLQVQGSLRLYAVPGKGGLLCLVEVDSVAGTAGGACADRDVLRTGSIYMAD